MEHDALTLPRLDRLVADGRSPLHALTDPSNEHAVQMYTLNN